MFTLGVNLLGNDTSAAVLATDGSIVAVAEEERYSRVKGGRRWASPAWVLEILDEHAVPRDAVSRLGVARIQSLHGRRRAAPSAAPPIEYWDQAKSVSVAWLVERLPSCSAVTEVRHHLCHAASAFYASPFDKAAVVTADGMGEVETATIWRAEGCGLEQVWSAELPHSLGLAYEAVAAWAGLTGVEREGKLMGLAALGVPRLADVVRDRLLRSDPDRVFVLADEVAALPPSTEVWVDYLATVFGPRGPGGNDVRPLDADVAASVQLVLEDCLDQLAVMAKRLTGLDRCVAAGGVFMNSVANGRLRRGGTFADFWVQPLAGDAGTSLGAAFVAHGGSLTGTRMRHAFLGSELGDVDAAASGAGLVGRDGGDLYKSVADLILDGKVVGWASGRAEVGPRALGHRSILADPRRAEIRQVLNAHTKEREHWRPFAPIVLEEDASCLVEPPHAVPFMNMVARARAADRIPAAVHIDGTARVQTVPRDEPELEDVRRLLEAIRARTGVGVLLNTSLNGRGEPIARTAHDVFAVHRSCRLDAVVVDGRLYVEDETCRPGACDGPQGTPPAVRGGTWIVVAPWWRPDDDAIATAVSPDSWAMPSAGDIDGLPVEVREHLRTESVDGVLIAVPVWVEVAVAALGSLLDALVPGSAGVRVVLLDESGRHLDARLPSGVPPHGPIERWWRRRLAAGQAG